MNYKSTTCFVKISC